MMGWLISKNQLSELSVKLLTLCVLTAPAFDPNDQQIRDICLAMPLFRHKVHYVSYAATGDRQTYAGKLQFAFKREVASLVRRVSVPKQVVSSVAILLLFMREISIL